MSGWVQPCKCYIEYAYINGVDIVRHVKVARVFETLCKPYLTGQIELIDTNNFIENMGLVGGETVSFAINTTRSRRDVELQILSFQGQQSTHNKRAMHYTFELIGSEYFGDRANIVQQAFSGTTATDACSSIYSTYLGSSLDVMVPSSGIIGKDNSYIVKGAKPFKAVSDLKKIMTFGSYKTGNVLNWRDRDGSHLAPLEYLFQTLSAQDTFYERGTWGASIQDLARVENAVIAASALVNPESGRAGLKGISSTQMAERKVLDFLTNKSIFDTMASGMMSGAGVGMGIGNFLGSIVGSVAGGHGGEHNYYISDSSRIPNANVRQTDTEKAYGAQVSGGPQYTIQVPIQSGLRLVVGKGLDARLLPPVGDQTSPFTAESQTGGLMLVVDAMHEAHLDDTQMAGTSTFRCARGGFG